MESSQTTTTQVRNRIIAAFVTVALGLSLAPLAQPAYAADTDTIAAPVTAPQQAAKVKTIKIKAGKTYKSFYYNYGVKLPKSFAIKNLKVKKTGKNKIITFNWVVYYPVPSAKQQKAIYKGYQRGEDRIAGTLELVMLDWKTGEALDGAKYYKWKDASKTSDGWVKKASQKVKLTVPANYKKTMIAIGQKNKKGDVTKVWYLRVK